jgi:two-component system LytT family response regulator
MRTVRALIVDDEKPARERLRRLLTRDGRTELAGSCAGGAEAVDVVRAAAQAGAPVHVMFLDVQKPELDGFGVLAALVSDRAQPPLPEIVFVTAHDEYALRAFDAQAIAYLLKPYSDEKFQATLDHALRHVRGRHADAVVAQMQALLDDTVRRQPGGAPASPLAASLARGRRPVDRIVVRGSDRVRLLPVEQISWIEAEGMYVKLHTRDGAVHLHRALLGTLDDTLDSRRFVRIHRSAIVNIDVVVELRQDAHGEYIAVLRDQTEIRVGRRFRARLQARLGQQL